MDLSAGARQVIKDQGRGAWGSDPGFAHPLEPRYFLGYILSARGTNCRKAGSETAVQGLGHRRKKLVPENGIAAAGDSTRSHKRFGTRRAEEML